VRKRRPARLGVGTVVIEGYCRPGSAKLGRRSRSEKEIVILKLADLQVLDPQLVIVAEPQDNVAALALSYIVDVAEGVDPGHVAQVDHVAVVNVIVIVVIVIVIVIVVIVVIIARSKVGDDVVSEAEDEAVVVTAASHLVVAFATIEDVVVVVAEELVFALATIELVVVAAPL
jgi:hypothetical protein